MGVICADTRRHVGWTTKAPMGVLIVLGLMGLGILIEAASVAPLRTQSVSPRKWRDSYARLPMSFELNRGQTDPRVKFLARGPGYTLFLTSDAAVLALQENHSVQAGDSSPPPDRVVRLRLVDANPAVGLSGEEELSGQSNYFLGNDPRRWRTHIPTYAQVRYRNMYRGVDLLYYGRQGELEYDFIVTAGADPGCLGLKIEGTDGIAVNPEGDLVLRTGGSEVRLRRPRAYQGDGREERGIAAQYVLRGGKEIGFAVGPYDRRRALIIDPVLSYATYLGGKGGDVAYGIAGDSSGNAYITGVTNSTDFPTLTPEQSSSHGSGEAFVSKLNATGTALVYSTYLGGAGSDTGTAIAVSASGDAFITGTTTSVDFPATPTAFQTVYGGNTDAFVAQLDSAGSALVYSSYLGGGGTDLGQGIAVDTSGNAYVTGSTQSINFPTVGPLQATNAGSSDVFVAKVNFSGSALIYSTYLGGTEAEVGQCITVNSSGNAFVVGYTFSSNYPTLNAYQASNKGQTNAFVTELNTAGSAPVFSTYFGGSGNDRGFGIALDASGNIYLTGASRSTDFPTTSSAFQISNHGQSDAFVTKLNPAGSAVLYSTFVGGSAVDQGNAIAVDASGDAFITGFTQSGDFPTANPLQAILGISGGGSCGATPCADAFVTQLNPSGNGLVYSTYLGGSGADFGQGIALDSSGNPYVTGSTSSTNFPAIAGAFQGSLSGVAGNTFVAKIDASNAPGIAITPAKLNFGNQTISVRSAAQAVTIIDAGTQPLQITEITSSSTDFAETDNCIGTLAAGGGTCTINITFTPSAVGSETDQITITDNASGSPHTITVTGTGVTAATAVTVTEQSDLWKSDGGYG